MTLTDVPPQSCRIDLLAIDSLQSQGVANVFPYKVEILVER